MLRAVAERGRRIFNSRILMSSQVAAAARRDARRFVFHTGGRGGALEDAAAVADALAWRPDALRALRAAQRAGRVSGRASGAATARPAGPLDVDGSGDVLAGWRGVVRDQVAAGARRRRVLRTTAGRRALLLDGHAEQTAVLRRVAAADAAAGSGAAGRRREPRDGPAASASGSTAGATRAPPPPMPPQLDIISLEDEHRDFRAALGVSVRPRGPAIGRRRGRSPTRVRPRLVPHARLDRRRRSSTARRRGSPPRQSEASSIGARTRPSVPAAPRKSASVRPSERMYAST